MSLSKALVSDIVTTAIFIGIKLSMCDSTFYFEKYQCTLMSLFYLKIINHILLFLAKKNVC